MYIYMRYADNNAGHLLLAVLRNTQYSFVSIMESLFPCWSCHDGSRLNGNGFVSHGCHGCLEHMWKHRLIDQRLKDRFLFPNVLWWKVGKQKLELIQLSRLCLQPIQSMWACHVTAMALGWQAIIEDGFWKMLSSWVVMHLWLPDFGKCRWRRNGRN